MKRKRNLKDVPKYIIGILIVMIVVGPILITLFASFKTKADMISSSALWFPKLERFTFENYRYVLGQNLLYVGFRNTIIIMSVSIVFNIMFGSITAYCLQRFEFRFKFLVYGLFALGMMIPTFVTEIARFKVINGLGLYNTLGAPIVIYIASDLMQIYIYSQFVNGISPALDESALIDGCGYFGVFYRIIFPLLKPATATLVIIKAVNIINDMYIPYLYMPKNSLKTLTTFLMTFAGSQDGSWQRLSAGIIIVLIPTTIIYILFQRHILEGVAAGAVKE